MTATAQLRIPPADGAAAALTRALQDAFRERALALLRRFLDEADDRLFDYAGRGGSAQEGYLRLMRGLRTQREAVLARFAAALDAQLEPGWRPHVVAGADSRDQGLRLIEDRVVEQRLAVQTTCQRLEGSCEAALYDFKQRLEGGRRRLGLRLLDVQFAPAALCCALVDGLGAVELDAGLLLVVLKIFEQVGRAGLEPAYAALADLLGAAGIERQAPAAAPAQRAAPAAVPPAGAGPIRALAANAAAIHALLRLPAEAPAQASLQTQLAEAARAAQEPAPPVWAQAVALRAAASAWLFEQILGDAGIPQGLRGGLEGLRTPFAHAALLENDFMRDPAHPLRRLIQDVAALAATARLAPAKEVAGIRDFITEMGFTLERSLPQRDLHGAAAVDEPVMESFSAAVREDGGRRRGLLVQQARELAAATVGEAVDRHLPCMELPHGVAPALERLFGPLLGLVLLRGGRASPAFAQAQALLDEFLGAVAGAAARPDFAARVAAAAAAAGLSASWQAGLCAVLDEALAAGPAHLPDRATAPPPAPRDPWSTAPGLEVDEVSGEQIEACAQALFLPGSWFRLPGGDGAPRWMQVERCDPALDEVRFRGACGGSRLVRPLQRLLLELLAGRCERIGGSPQGERLLAALGRRLGIGAAPAAA